MPTATTNDIKISVTVHYQGVSSSPQQEHVFAYKISIENNGEYTVQLLRRHWKIKDFGVKENEVEGEGVVGQQPILEPGESHSYVSSVWIESDFGSMSGTYLMERQLDGKQFNVRIPLFKLIVPHRLN